MTARSGQHESQTVRSFLISPHDKRKANAFFARCLAIAIAHLRCLKAKSWQLPDDQYPSDNPIRDLAVELLIGLCKSRSNEPYFRIFEFYSREGYPSFDDADEHELDYLLGVLIRSFVTQRLSRLRKQADPQIENLKRRVNDTIKASDRIHVATAASSGYDRIAFAEVDMSSDSLELWPQQELNLIAEIAYQDSNSRSMWCYKLLELVADDGRFVSWVYRHMMITAMIRVSRINELERYDLTAYLPATEHGLSEDQVKQAFRDSRSWLKESVLPGFVGKKRLSIDEIEPMLKAFDAIVADGLHSGTIEKLPVYFRENMPVSTHSNYLKKYKYVFETAMKGGLNHLAEILDK
ncbi:MAG TPA: hypothetical protein PLF13_03265 [candidate division Zixibacteria bacterium]|nr:hypothetical protein [candidate division Zixibacteria bacterium]